MSVITFIPGLILSGICSLSLINWTCIFLAFGLWFYWWMTIEYRIWENKGLFSIKPDFYFGNTKDSITLKKSVNDVAVDQYFAYKEHGVAIVYHGTEALLYVADLKLVKQIMVTDFDHFTDFGLFNGLVNDLPVNNLGLANTKGDSWRKFKASVTPAFRLKNMKQISSHLNKISLRVVDSVKKLEKSKSLADFEEITGKYTMECIATSVFSMYLDSNSAASEEFVNMGKGLLEDWRFIFATLAPTLMTKLKIPVWGATSVKFFVSLTKQLMEERSKMANPPMDILGIMLKEREERKKNGDETMTDEMIVSTGMQFFLDGYHTVNSVLKHCFYFLAVNPDVQDKAMQEVDDFADKHGDHVDKENVDELQYLDWVLNETARLTNLATITFRTTTKPWKIPGKNVTLPVGMRVLIPIIGPHMDPEYFEEPKKFIPERHSSDNKFVPYSYKPWGAGPRACIGIQITRMESRVLLYQILRRFKLEPGPETNSEIVWKKTEMYSMEGGVKLRVISRD